MKEGEFEWGVRWKRSGDCAVCGKFGVLVERCQRCGKWACGKADCLGIIKGVEWCVVKTVGR